MKCTICHKPIVLIPSAESRAKKFGGKPSDYIKQFTEHAECILKKREEDAYRVMKQLA